MNRLLILACICVVGIASPFQGIHYPGNLAWLFGQKKKAIDEPKNQPVCQTEECKLIAKFIRESMDDRVDPCEDFYEYACGNWANNNEVPEGESSWDLWHMVQNKITDAVLEILSTETKPDDILAAKLGKKWFRVCTDTEKIEKEGLEPLLSTLNRIGGWPVIMDPDEWDERVYHWEKVDDYYTRLDGANTFLELYVADFYGDGEIIAITTPHLPPRSYRLYAGDKGDDGDDSNENESEEKSEEPGSEEEHKNEEEEENDDKEEEEEENEDKEEEDRKVARKTRRNKSKLKKLSHKRISKRPVKKTHGRIKRRVKNHGKQSRLEKIKRTTKRTDKQSYPRHTKITKLAKRKRIEEERKEEENSKEPRNQEESKEDEDNGEDKEEENKDKEEGEDGESTEESAEENREVYKRYVLNVAKTLASGRDIEVSEETMAKQIDDMIGFQVKLTELVNMDEDHPNMTLSEFQEMCDETNATSNGKVNWLRKIRRMFAEADVEITGDELAIVACGNYIRGLSSLLDETPTVTIVNYIHWRFISHMMMASTKKMVDLYQTWENYGDDNPEEEEKREKRCAKEIEMHDIVAYEYVKKYFSSDIKRLALDLIDDIQKEVEYQVKESEWIEDEDTKDFILDKLVNLERLVGYPDWYENATIVRRFFRGLVVSSSYYENVLSYMRYISWKHLRGLSESSENESWEISPMTLNAFFMPTENSITITAADFQNPFFALNRPQSINYGIIGFVMAHEVNHGFDNDGHLFDKNGKPMEWLSTMAAAYNERAECFVDQFNKYPILKSSNLTIKNYGNQTAGENIADTMGLQSVFRAYQRRQRECGKRDPPLPGLEKFTNEQLFFLSFANLWCEAVVDQERAVRMARFDVHSPGRLRVIGSVSNSEDFAKAYDCPTGSPMNPKRKCNIWK